MIFQKFFLTCKNFCAIKLKGLLVFFREIFSNPKAMGTALPSSKKLANTLAKQIPSTATGTIVELGPGTGVVTKALLDHGIKPEKLILIEKSNAFVKHLSRRFSSITIIEGDAQQLNQLLEPYQPIQVIISCLPLRLLPASVVKNILQAIEKTLIDKGLLIQFTYHHGKANLPLSKHFQLVHSERVFLNFPPARVDVFSYKSEDS